MLRGDLLTPWARWITPEAEPRRYDTRFFVARLPDGQRALGGTGESDEAAWLRPDAALAAAEAGDLVLLPPTAVTLQELAAHPEVAAMVGTRRQIVLRQPVITFTDGQAWLVIPDTGAPASPGAGRRGAEKAPPKIREPAMTVDGSGTSFATCVLAPNPSPMTLEGTNTWLIAASGSPSALVVDPGPEDEGHLRRIVERAAATGRRVAQILLTPGHSDHSAGARRLAALTGAPVRAADPAHRLGSEGLVDANVVAAAGCELRVIGTPGHSADSLSLLLSQDAALLTGDTMLGRGTTVIAAGGSLADYLRSLDAMKALADTASVRVLLPGHGPVVSDPGSTLTYYIEHRAERLAEVRAALAAGDTTVQQIVARVYRDVDPAVRRLLLSYLPCRRNWTTWPPPVSPGPVTARRTAVRMRSASGRMRSASGRMRSASGRACAGARCRQSAPNVPRFAASRARQSPRVPC